MTDSAKPGYRRRIVVTPGLGQIVARLEDDFHCMAVTLSHEGGIVHEVLPETLRYPWNTCPGAGAALVETFRGLPLQAITARRDKKRNCTHLHDLAVLAAAHALDAEPLNYAIEADDPVDGQVEQRLWRNGELVFTWRERDGTLISPPDIAGQTLFSLRDWIAGLPEPQREAARLLQWASIVAHGRTIAPEHRREASDMPANCYTFQPEQAVRAERLQTRRDFSTGAGEPLDGSGGAGQMFDAA